MNTWKVALLEDLGYLKSSLPSNKLNEGLKHLTAAGLIAANIANAANNKAPVCNSDDIISIKENDIVAGGMTDKEKY